MYVQLIQLHTSLIYFLCSKLRISLGLKPLQVESSANEEDEDLTIERMFIGEHGMYHVCICMNIMNGGTVVLTYLLLRRYAGMSMLEHLLFYVVHII